MKEPSAPAGGEEVLACALEASDPDVLLAGALARDLDRAFEQVVIAYRVRIVTFVARMLHDDPRAEDGAPRAELSDPQPGPEALALREEAWASVDLAIARLSPALRAAFVMRYVDDLPYEEIAQSLDQPVGTVKASAHRGLMAVRAQLENNDE